MVLIKGNSWLICHLGAQDLSHQICFSEWSWKGDYRLMTASRVWLSDESTQEDDVENTQHWILTPKLKLFLPPFFISIFFSSDPIPFLILVSIWFFSEPKRWSCITPSCSLTFVRESSVGWGQQFGSDHFTWLFSLLLAARILFSPSHTVHVLHRCFKSVTVIDRCTCSTDLRQISSHSSVSSPRASLSSVGYSSKRGCLKIHDHWLLNENNNV